jgi:N-acetylneuraminate lyase
MRSDDPGLVILSGADEVCLTALIMGADGAIGANFNALADRFVRIDRLFLEGRVDEAARIQREANGVIEVISRHGFIRSIKYLLSLEGIDCGECRKPFAPLSADAMRELETVHREHLKKE